MTAAFKEFTGKTLNKTKKPSVRKKFSRRSQPAARISTENGRKQKKGERADIMSRLQKLLGVGKGYLERLPPNVESYIGSAEYSVCHDFLCGK